LNKAFLFTKKHLLAKNVSLINSGAETGFSALDLTLDEIRSLPGGEMPDGSGWAFVGEDFDSYEHLLPSEIRAKIAIGDEEAIKIKQYYESQDAWFFGNTTTIKEQYQQRFNDPTLTPEQRFKKQWILGWGVHDTLKRSWFGGETPETNPQMLIEDQPSDGLAQQRFLDGHVTDIYIHEQFGHFAIHGRKDPEAPNAFLDGLLEHIILELPSWVLKQFTGQEE